MANTGNRTATVNVRIASHVPKELHHLWQSAAQTLENRGQLRSASGQVDYKKVNEAYGRLLAGYHGLARKASLSPVRVAKEEVEEEEETKEEDKDEGKKASVKPWPFKDITPNHIARFASAGRWDLVKMAAVMVERASAKK